MTWAQRSDSAPMPAYKISKAALNALTVQYARSYEESGFTFVAVHPGVRADFSLGIDEAYH